MDKPYTLIHASVADLPQHVAKQSLDAIITDPPYPGEFVALFGVLAEVAVEVLKPGASLIVMSGQCYLPEIYALFDRMKPRLLYHWTSPYLLPGGQALQLFPKRIMNYGKMLLWYTHGPYQPPRHANGKEM